MTVSEVVKMTVSEVVKMTVSEVVKNVHSQYWYQYSTLRCFCQAFSLKNRPLHCAHAALVQLGERRQAPPAARAVRAAAQLRLCSVSRSDSMRRP